MSWNDKKEKSSDWITWIAIAAVVLILFGKCTLNIITEKNQPKNVEIAMDAYNSGDYEKALKYWNKTDLKKNKTEDLSFSNDATQNMDFIRKASVWWARKAKTYEELGKKEEAELLYSQLYSSFVKSENENPGFIKSNYPDVYQAIINSDSYIQKHEQAIQARKAFMDKLSNCKTVTSRWLEYNGELGTWYKIAAYPYWDSSSNYWIDDGKSDKLAGGIFLYTDFSDDYLKDKFKELAYYEVPTYFYIEYHKSKSRLVYIED